jgi:hypothetical protein
MSNDDDDGDDDDVLMCYATFDSSAILAGNPNCCRLGFYPKQVRVNCSDSSFESTGTSTRIS